MLVSTLIVGSIPTANAAITGNIYFDNYNTKWSTVYCFLGHGSYIRSYQMTLDSDDIWKTTVSFNNEWSDATGIFFATTDGGVSSGTSDYNISTAKSTLGVTAYTNTQSNVSGGTNNCYVPADGTNGAAISLMTVAAAKATHSGSSQGGAVTDADLIAVLNGTKVMFYYGDVWGSGTKYLRTGSNTGQVDTGTSTQYTVYNSSSSTVTGHMRLVCLASNRYYISNSSSWPGVQMSANAVGGNAYVLNSDGGENIKVGPSRSGATFTKASYSITKGTAASGVSASLKNTKSVANSNNTLEYYYTGDDGETFYKFTPSNAGALEVGTYTIIALVKDVNGLMVKAATATLAVTASGQKAVGSNLSLVCTTSEPMANEPINLSASFSKTSGVGDVRYSFTNETSSTLGGAFSTNNITTSANSQEVTFTPTNAGTYTFKVTVSATNYTSITATCRVTVSSRPTYYIGGRFIGNNWAIAGTTYNMTYDSAEDAYKYETEKTYGELSSVDYGCYFVIHDGSSNAYGSGEADYDIKSHNSKVNAADVVSVTYNDSGADKFMFADTESLAGPVTLWFDATNMKLWYTVPDGKKITITSGANGSVVYGSSTATNGNPVEENLYGSSYRLTIKPNTGYEVDTFTVNGVNKKSSLTASGSNFTFTESDVDSDKDVSVTFKKKSYNLHVTSVTNGGTVTLKSGTSEVTVNSDDASSTATASNSISIWYQNSYSISVTPDFGCRLKSITVGGTTYTGISAIPASFTMGAGNVTVQAVFEAIKPTMKYIDVSSLNTENPSRITSKSSSLTIYAKEEFTLTASADDATSYVFSATGGIQKGTQTDGECKFTSPNTEGSATITVYAVDDPDGVAAVNSEQWTITINIIYTDAQIEYNSLKDIVENTDKDDQVIGDYNLTASDTLWIEYLEAASNAKTDSSDDFPGATFTGSKYSDTEALLIEKYDAIQDKRKATTIYVLSSYDSGVGMHLWDENGVYTENRVVVSGGLTSTDGSFLMQKQAGTVRKTAGGTTYYLYKLTYTHIANFIIFQGSTGIGSNNKFTTDITNVSDYGTYFFDLSEKSIGNGDSTIKYTKDYKTLTAGTKKAYDSVVLGNSYNFVNAIDDSNVSGTLKNAGALITYTYVDTSDNNRQITTPSAWSPATAGLHRIRITVSNGITGENKTVNFKLYVQIPLETPNLVLNITGGASNLQGNVTVTEEDAYTVNVVNASDYSLISGVKLQFTVDGVELTAGTNTSLSYDPLGLSWTGNGTPHTISVKAIAPNTYIEEGVPVTVYADSLPSNTLSIAVKTVKFRVKYDFSKSNVTSVAVIYKEEKSQKNVTISLTKSGSFMADKGSEVKFTATPQTGYDPIPDNKGFLPWADVEGATISGLKSNIYTFICNAAANVTYRTYCKTVVTAENTNIKIGTPAKLTITSGYDPAADYTFYTDVVSDDNIIETTNNGNKYTTKNLAFGEYKFFVREETAYYFYDIENPVEVNAVLGTLRMQYKYRDYDVDNGISYNPFVDSIEDNLESTPKVYTYTIQDYDMRNVVNVNTGNAMSAAELAIIYKEQAPAINSKYFNYTLDVNSAAASSTNGWALTVLSSATPMTPEERLYQVSIVPDNGREPIRSFYQQKTYYLDAADYVTSAGEKGYVWYIKDNNDKTHVLSTNQIYKLRVTENTTLYVKANDTDSPQAQTFLNNPDYTRSTVNNRSVVTVNLLVENFVPDNVVRIKTGVVFATYTYGGESPSIDENELMELILDSYSKGALGDADAGAVVTLGDVSANTIQGSYTDKENTNGKFLYTMSIASGSQKIRQYYSYVIYTKDGEFHVALSNPVEAGPSIAPSNN